MRLLKLSLVFLMLVFALDQGVLAQSKAAPAAPVIVPPHSTNQLVNRFDYATRGRTMPYAPGTVAVMMANGIVLMVPPDMIISQRRPGSRHFNPDPKMNLAPQLAALPGAPCYKLRKFIVQPKEQTWSNGVTPLGSAPIAGDWKIVGETDCTPAQKVWPKSAEGVKPPQPGVGFHSTVLRQK